ncbi:MAG: MFS transporter [Thermoguttaceae bacterium]|nr:MFS transporter [Thermoguttaceae bacterium]MBQ9127475.1 MFS transporter [Thermoguttaceae bacterium]
MPRSSSSEKRVPDVPRPAKPISSFYRWELLALLFLAYFFHQSDRAIYGVVATSIKSEFHLSDQTLYATRTIMFALMALVVPLAGFVGDKANKRKLLIGCLFCWSAATLLTGASWSLLSLILFNSVGLVVAEAFYGPASTSLIASYHKETRSVALSIHQTAVYLSVIFCGLVGGWLSERLSWRAAFWTFGAISVLIGGLLIWRLRDPAKDGGASDGETAKSSGDKVSVGEFLGMIFRNPSALCLTVGFTAIVFVNNAYLNVVPKFLQDRFALTPTSAGFHGMFWHHIAALIFIFVGASLSDKVSRRFPTFRPKLQCLAMALGVPVVAAMGRAGSPEALFGLFFLMGVCRGFYECNTHAAVFETVPAKYRSTTVGFMIMFAFLIGSWSAQMVGACVDSAVAASVAELGEEAGRAQGYVDGYRTAFTALSCAWLIGAVCVGVAAFGTIAKDRQKRIDAEAAANATSGETAA